jgi:hypothetical protein
MSLKNLPSMWHEYKTYFLFDSYGSKKKSWSWMVFIHVYVYYLNKIQNVISILLFTFLNLDIGYSLQRYPDTLVLTLFFTFQFHLIGIHWKPIIQSEWPYSHRLLSTAEKNERKSLWNSSHSVELHKEALRKKRINEWKQICKRYDTLVHTNWFHFLKWLYQMNLNIEYRKWFPFGEFPCD